MIRSVQCGVRRLVCSLGLLAGAPLTACGDDAAPLQVNFQMQTLDCDRAGLLAYLQVIGVPGICPLQVNADRTVSGACAPVPTGEIREFRLVYYTVLDEQEVQLATVRTQVDLRDESRSSIVVDFEASPIMSDIDEDDDGRSNLVEFCEGTDLRVPD